MKTPRSIPFFFVFGSFMLLGVFAGFWTRSAASSGEQTITASDTPVPTISISPSVPADLHPKTETAPNGQRNLLVIGVDNLQKNNPSLEAVWLVLYLPPSPKLTLVPLYPEGLAPTVQSKPLNEVFSITSNHQIGKEFIAALEAYDLWWNNYLVLDKTSLAQAIDAAGGLKIGAEVFGGKQVLSGLFSSTRNPRRALQTQLNLLIASCQNPAHTDSQLNYPDQLAEKLGNRLITDLTPAQMVSDWQTLGATDGRSCRFPTLPRDIGEY